MSAILETVQACASLWLMRATPAQTGGDDWENLRMWTMRAHEQCGEAATLRALQEGLIQGRSHLIFISPAVIG